MSGDPLAIPSSAQVWGEADVDGAVMLRGCLTQDEDARAQREEVAPILPPSVHPVLGQLRRCERTSVQIPGQRRCRPGFLAARFFRLAGLRRQRRLVVVGVLGGLAGSEACLSGCGARMLLSVGDASRGDLTGELWFLAGSF